MTINYFENVFSVEDLNLLKLKTDYTYDNDTENLWIDERLGRIVINDIKINDTILEKVNYLAESTSKKKLKLSGIVAVEYSNKYGSPNLPVHFDHDHNDLIINFQISANTTWGVGVDYEVYKLKDNSAVVFNANQYVHWRPHKIFKKEEYVKMIFFRFVDPDFKSDYSNLGYSIDDPIFKDINKFRDSFLET